MPPPHPSPPGRTQPALTHLPPGAVVQVCHVQGGARDGGRALGALAAVTALAALGALAALPATAAAAPCRVWSGKAPQPRHCLSTLVCPAHYMRPGTLAACDAAPAACVLPRRVSLHPGWAWGSWPAPDRAAARGCGAALAHIDHTAVQTAAVQGLQVGRLSRLGGLPTARGGGAPSQQVEAAHCCAGAAAASAPKKPACMAADAWSMVSNSTRPMPRDLPSLIMTMAREKPGSCRAARGRGSAPRRTPCCSRLLRRRGPQT